MKRENLLTILILLSTLRLKSYLLHFLPKRSCSISSCLLPVYRKIQPFSLAGSLCILLFLTAFFLLSILYYSQFKRFCQDFLHLFPLFCPQVHPVPHPQQPSPRFFLLCLITIPLVKTITIIINIKISQPFIQTAPIIIPTI